MTDELNQAVEIGTSNFAKFLREQRLEKGLSQPELAKMLTGDSNRRSLISDYENERKFPSFVTVLKLIEILGYKIVFVDK